MILIRVLFNTTLLLSAPVQAQGPEPLVRRIAATALLAAQEYGLGFSGDRVVSTAEIDEARLFLAEAIRAANELPADDAVEAQESLRAALALVQATAPPDSVSAAVQGLVSQLALRFQVELDEIPEATPSLARGASIFQSRCASCHGTLGWGDGPAGVALNPRPASLVDGEALREASPLDFYRRTTIGIAGTAMPGFETTLSPEDRWAVALYASTLRLPAPAGAVPPALSAFPTTARMSDAEIMAALGPAATPATLAAVRSSPGTAPVGASVAALSRVRSLIDSAITRAGLGYPEDARRAAFDAYLAFERVEREVRIKNASLATDLEARFAELREQAAAGASAERLAILQADLLADLERAERVVVDRPGPVGLFLQSLVLLVREGLEAILVIGALIAFLVKTGSGSRRRDIHIGVGAAVAASLLTAITLETAFRISPAGQELLEGITMAAAAVMLFYVSYWLLSKIEVARWNRFVKAKVRDALSSGSALALATVAFLAVYREGFETVLFYKALMLSAGPLGLGPVLMGMLVGAVILAVVYVAISRFGVRLPLRPFFAVTSGFLYYMAFVFAGKAVAEFQESGVVGTTVVEWAPRVPVMGVYPTVETLLAQGLVAGLAVLALLWVFLVAPARRLARERAARPGVVEVVNREVLRSLDRIDADVAEIRAEIDRLRDRICESRGDESRGDESRVTSRD